MLLLLHDSSRQSLLNPIFQITDAFFFGSGGFVALRQPDHRLAWHDRVPADRQSDSDWQNERSSQNATRLFLSWDRQAVTMASEIWSQILSGCPHETCSLVKIIKKILLSYVRMRERMKDASGQEKRAYGKLRRPSLLFWRL